MSNTEDSPISNGTNLYIRLLGTPEIHLYGAPLLLGDQKAQALLFYLIATGQPHTRDHLATLLWGGSAESNARHSLRSSLYHLRHTFQMSGIAEILVVNNHSVSLNLRQEASDIARFRSLIAANTEGALAEAVSLYQGTLLAGFTLIEAPAFEDWVRSEAIILSEMYLSALDRLATQAADQQAWSEAIRYVQKIIQMDPLDEAAQQRLIQLYLRSGSIGRALRQYQQFARELEHELSITPSRETQDLIHRALMKRRQATPETRTDAATTGHLPAEVMSEKRVSDLPFIGRDETLAQLLAISQNVRAGHGATVLLQAEGGMGKTRLLQELIATLAVQPLPWMVLQGNCSPFDDLQSYGPFYEALHTATSGDLTDLLIAELKIGDDKADSIPWRVLQALRLLTQSGPLLLSIDDLHWANSSTLRLFGFLATRVKNLPVLLIGTIQQTEAIPAMQRLLTVSRPHRTISLLTLPPLTFEAVLDLLTQLGLSNDSAMPLAKWLVAQSGGSPFILGEILAQMRAEMLLTTKDSHWHFNATRWLRWRMSFTLPATTYDLVAWRLDPLSPHALHLLNVLAVSGQSLPLALLCEFPGMPVDQSRQMVDELLARQLLTEAADDTVALPHHLIREAILARLSHSHRRAIHRQLLEMIEQCSAYQRHFPLRQVALHAVAGEDVARARRYGLPALDVLLQDAPSAETLSFVHHLHDLLAPTASPDELHRLTHALGQLYQSLGQLEAAAIWHQHHLEIAHQIGDPVALTVAHFERGELALVANDYLKAVAMAKAGLALCDAAADPRLTILTGRGYWLLGAAIAMEGSDLPGAESYLKAAAEVHQRLGYTSDLCADLFDLGNVAAQRGELVQALAFYQEAGHTAEIGRVPYFQALAQNNIAYHSLLLGHIDAAQQAASQGLREAEAHESVGALLHLFSTHGEIRLYLAEWESAAEWFERGLLLAEELGNIERQAGYRAGLALSLRGRNDLDGAKRLLEEAQVLIRDRGYWHLQTRISLWLAEICLQLEHLDAAWLHLEQALAYAQSQGRTLLAMQGERLRSCLLAAKGNWRAAQQGFAHTLEQAQALDLPLEIARTQAAWGIAALHAVGATPETQTLLARASEIFIAYHAHADLQWLTAEQDSSRLAR
jgi:DNA-binding SARP family transcriptional activator